MTIKQKLRHPQFQQQILEVAFPLLGYFFWDWSLLIIVVFYLLDFLASQIMYSRRLAKIISVFNEKLNGILILSILTSALFVLIIIFMTHSFFETQYLLLNKSLNSELITFAKDELWYLFPIILLSYYMMDKMMFYMPKRFFNFSVRLYFKKNILANLIAILLIGLGLYLYTVINPSDLVAIIGIVLIKLGFDFGIKKQILKMD